MQSEMVLKWPDMGFYCHFSDFFSKLLNYFKLSDKALLSQHQGFSR